MEKKRSTAKQKTTALRRQTKPFRRLDNSALQAVAGGLTKGSTA